MNKQIKLIYNFASEAAMSSVNNHDEAKKPSGAAEDTTGYFVTENESDAPWYVKKLSKTA